MGDPEGDDSDVQTPADGIGLPDGLGGAERSGAELALEDAESRLERLPGWSLAEDAGAIQSTVTFAGPGDALAAVGYLAGTARVRGWSASLQLTGSRVRVRLRATAGGRVSAAEFLAAREVSQTLQRLGAESSSR